MHYNYIIVLALYNTEALSLSVTGPREGLRSVWLKANLPFPKSLQNS